MGSQRAPRGPWAGAADGVRSARVSGAGKVVNASPVSQVQTAVDEALASVAGATDTEHKIDLFTLAASGAQTLTLTYLPAVDSWNVSCGLPAIQGTDYTISGQTLSLLAALDARAGEVVQVQYDYLTGVPAAPAVDPGVYGPVALYRMDETSGTTLVDSSGNGRNGTYTGSPTLGSAALVTSGGTSVTFDGSNYASIPAASIPAFGDQLSFEAWVATTSTAAVKVFLGCDNDTERALQFRFNAGKPEVVLLPFVGSLAAPTAKNDGYPHHCVATYNGVIIRLYVDGVEVATLAATGNLGVPTTLPWVIGERSPTVGAYAWVGRIDNVGIYNYALSAAQVAELYDAGN